MAPFYAFALLRKTFVSCRRPFGGVRPGSLDIRDNPSFLRKTLRRSRDEIARLCQRKVHTRENPFPVKQQSLKVSSPT